MLQRIVGISELNANSIDPDQTPRSAAYSDLVLHCLPVSLLWDAKFKWVKRYIIFKTNIEYPDPTVQSAMTAMAVLHRFYRRSVHLLSCAIMSFPL